MKHRAITDLQQLGKKDFIYQVATGLSLIHDHVVELQASSESLIQNGRFRAHRIIEAIVCEEAAKYLILLDAVRCPWKESALRSEQLSKFNEHLAKGVYAKACGWRPDRFGTLCSYVATELDEYYLDGPEGVDWIFRNRIISEREERCYVDYVEMDGEHQWISPDRSFMDELTSDSHSPAVIRMITAAHCGGIADVASLMKFAEHWRAIEIGPETLYREFMNINFQFWESVWSEATPENLSEEARALLIHEFPFPMYSIRMKSNRIDRKSLEEIQNNWAPE